MDRHPSNLYLPESTRLTLGTKLEEINKEKKLSLGKTFAEDKKNEFVSRSPEKPRATASPRTQPAQPRHRSRSDPVETRPLGDQILYHATNEAASQSIRSSKEFLPSRRKQSTGYRPMFGEMIYFAASVEHAKKKALRTASDDCVVLSCRVSLGQALVTGDSADPPAAVQRTLGISGWHQLTAEVLKSQGCKSVLGTNRGIDEFAVPSTSQIHRDTIRVADYQVASPTPTTAPSSQPWWLWPAWVTSLANHVGVDHAALDAVAAKHGRMMDVTPAGTVGGVRVNSAGRPIHTDGKFMSYAEAKSRGWKGPPGTATKTGSASTGPSPAGPLKKDGTPDMRYKVNKDAADGGGSSGKARQASGAYAGSQYYAVSANPTGPLKKDGTPDMRYKANRASGGSSGSSPHVYGGGGRSAYGSDRGGLCYGGGLYGGGGGSSGYSGSSGFSGSACYQVSSSPSGPLKADGTPDMRYSANRR